MAEKLHFDDLTKITCPLGILDDDTLQRLEAWPHGHEWWTGYEWSDLTRFRRHRSAAVRAKPAPVKRVWWCNVYPSKISSFYLSREDADAWAGNQRIAVYRVEWDETGHAEWFREEL